MKEASADEILKSHGLRKTLGRLKVLEFFSSQQKAISHSELSKHFEGQLDRSSLFRTLQDFESHGLVHKVPDDVVSTKFALCSGPCDEGAHYDSHLHFKCGDCQETYCLDGAQLPKLNIPSGFKPERAEVLVHGICRACA